MKMLMKETLNEEKKQWTEEKLKKSERKGNEIRGAMNACSIVVFAIVLYYYFFLFSCFFWAETSYPPSLLAFRSGGQPRP